MMKKHQQIPAEALVRGEPGRAFFAVSDDLTVCMCDGLTNSLSIRLTPAEARGFSQKLSELAALAEESDGLSLSECVGEA